MRTILVLTDFSKKAERAAEYAYAIAEKVHAEIILYHAFPTPQVSPVIPSEPLAIVYAAPSYDEYLAIEKESLEQLNQLADHLGQQLNSADNPAIKIINAPGNLTNNISDLLKTTEDIWMIAMGEKTQKEDTVSRFFLESDTLQVINSSICPVLLVPERTPLRPIKKVAFATNLDKKDIEALTFLAELMDIYQGEIVVVHVISDKVSKKDINKDLEHLKKLSNKFNYLHIQYDDILTEEFGASIQEFTRNEDIDLIAMVHKKRTYLERIFQKDNTQQLYDIHTIPLLVYPDHTE